VVLWERRWVDYPARSGSLAAGLEPPSDSLSSGARPWMGSGCESNKDKLYHFVCESNQEIPHIERMQLKFASIIECRTVLA
jgi:hypothetical protein